MMSSLRQGLFAAVPSLRAQLREAEERRDAARKEAAEILLAIRVLRRAADGV